MDEALDQSDMGDSSAAKKHLLHVVEGPLHSRRWSLFFVIAAGTALTHGTFILITLGGTHGDEWRHIWLPLTGWLLYLAKRIHAKGGLEVLLADQRAPVLYLRTFKADESELSSMNSNFWGLFSSTDEPQLVAKLSSIGPVVTIGRPGEKLPHLGAARLYVVDDDWESVVRLLMVSAKLVVFRAGTGPGLKWELSCAREVLSPLRVIVWFPGKYTRLNYAKHTRHNYATFRDIAGKALETDLPDKPPDVEVLAFDLNWRPFWISSVKAAVARTWEQQQASSPDKRTVTLPSPLRDLLAQLAVSKTPPPHFHLHVVAWVICVLWLTLLWGHFWYFSNAFVSYSSDALVSYSHAILTFIIETVESIIIPLSLAFIPYIYSPRRRLIPSLVFSVALVAYAYWTLTHKFAVIP